MEKKVSKEDLKKELIGFLVLGGIGSLTIIIWDFLETLLLGSSTLNLVDCLVALLLSYSLYKHLMK